MANSFVDIQVTGVASYSFSFPYLSQDHIKVYVGESIQALGTHYTFTDTYTIQFTAGNIPADTEQYIRILRDTSTPSRLVTYSNTGLDADDLNLNADQVFYMAQEAVDTIEIIEGIDVAGLLDKTTERYARSDFLGSDSYQTIGDRALFSPSLHGGAISSIVQVFLNGVLLKPTTVALDFSTGDYDLNSTSGLSISPVPAASDEISVVKTSAIPEETLDEITELSESAALVTTIGHGGKSVKETFTATAGQTVINLTNTYVQDINNVSVYVNGVRQSAYDETTTSSITLVNPLAAGDEIVVIINEYAVNQAGIDASLVNYVPEATGAFERTIGSKLGETVSVKDFGAKGDGVTDDTAAIQAAINASGQTGSSLLIPDGTFLVKQTGGTIFTPHAGCVISGVSSSTSKLVVETENTTYTEVFGVVNDDFLFSDLSLEVNAPVAASVQIFHIQANGVKIKNSKFDGGNTPSNSNLINFLTFSNSNTSDIAVQGCDIGYFQRVILRATERTGLIKNVDFSHNSVHDLGQGGIQFNTPHYGAVDVKISNNHFTTFHDGIEQIYCGGAGVKGFVVQGNTFSGVAKECLHFEEDAEDITITGNVFRADAKGVALYSNAALPAFPTAIMPKRVVITGNTFTDGSLTRQHTAILAPTTTFLMDSCEDLTVTSNTIRGYDVGVRVGETPAKVSNNEITNCDVGLDCVVPWPEVYNNSFDNCSQAITSNKGGIVGNNFFRNPLVIADSADNSKISLSGFKLSLETDVVLPNGQTTTVNVGIPVGTEMFGNLKVMSYLDSAVLYKHRFSEVSYDGTTFTDTEKMATGAGSVNINNFVNNSGQLALEIANSTGSGQTLTQLSVEFDGMWVSGS